MQNDQQHNNRQLLATKFKGLCLGKLDFLIGDLPHHVGQSKSKVYHTIMGLVIRKMYIDYGHSNQIHQTCPNNLTSHSFMDTNYHVTRYGPYLYEISNKTFSSSIQIPYDILDTIYGLTRESVDEIYELRKVLDPLLALKSVIDILTSYGSDSSLTTTPLTIDKIYF